MAKCKAANYGLKMDILTLQNTTKASTKEKSKKAGQMQMTAGITS